MRSHLLDRADSDTVRFAQSTIDGSRLRYAHLGAADEQRHVGGVGVTVSDEAGGFLRWVNGRLEHEAIGRGIAQRVDSLHVDTAASLATGQPNQSGVRHE